ncbi:diguanylate cyclase [Geovibrio thiophilus]|uniref:Diguanylate cyclase n=1 Tax=Geovibrio thiophilus TaxID=139438 RepID=A0A3R5XXB1_9BACT|nr:diguanylate cyclase [Geovibrio thiophilus]QAR32991.1 diguanylate cyclase [Geovibrio thiophilus]
MLKFKNLSEQIFLSAFTAAVVTVVTVGFLWVKEINTRFDEEAATLKTAQINSRKELIRTQVDEVKAFIDFEKGRTEDEIGRFISAGLENILASAGQIAKYEKHNELLSSLISLALNLQTDIFILDKEGMFLAHSSMPELIGSHVFTYKDADELSPYETLFKNALTGFKANTRFRSAPKEERSPLDISASAALEKRSGLIIGVQINRELFLGRMREKIFRSLAHMSLGQDGYFIVADFDGYLHANFGSFYDPPLYFEKFQDSTGKYPYLEIKEFLEKEDGTFYSYLYPRRKGGKPLNKISYFAADRELNAIYGTGLYIDDIEAEYEAEKTVMAARTKKSIIQTVAVLLVTLIVISLIARRISERIKRSFGSFMLFFERGRDENARIAPDELFFTEFRILAEYANRMIDERIGFENRLEEKHLALLKETEEKQETEKRFKTVIAVMREGVLIQDGQGRIISINASLREMFGIGDTGIIGRTLESVGLKFTDETDNVTGSFCPPIAACRTNGKPSVDSIIGLKKPDGNTSWFIVNVMPLFTSNADRVDKTAATFSDISTRKELHDELEKTRASLENAQTISNIGNWEWNLRSGRLWLSRMFYTIHGIREGQEVVLESFLEKVHEHDRNRLKKHLQDLARKNIPFETEYKVSDQSGQDKWVHAKAVTSVLKNGEKVITGTVQDITAMRKAQHELKNAYFKLNEYVEIIDENVIVSETDKKGLITSVSKAFCLVSGFSREELIGKKHNDFKYDRNDPPTADDIRFMVLSGEKWTGEVRNRRKNGELYWVKATVSPKFNPDGTVIGMLSVRQDITDRKKVEELSLTDELTGLHNRRFFNSVLSAELKRVRRDSKFLTFVLLDVDKFKEYNDTYGHTQGDMVLKSVAHCLKGFMLRSSDYSFRLGGEEFGLLFSGLDEEKSAEFLEKIRGALENLMIEHTGNPASKFVTSSFGGICVNLAKYPKIDMDSLYKAADEELYKSKDAGRNRISLRTMG